MSVIETCTHDSDVKINGSEATILQIGNTFGLTLNTTHEWVLVGDSLVDVPRVLGMSSQLITFAPIFQTLITAWRAEPA